MICRYAKIRIDELNADNAVRPMCSHLALCHPSYVFNLQSNSISYHHQKFSTTPSVKMRVVHNIVHFIGALIQLVNFISSLNVHWWQFLALLQIIWIAYRSCHMLQGCCMFAAAKTLLWSRRESKSDSRSYYVETTSVVWHLTFFTMPIFFKVWLIFLPHDLCFCVAFVTKW